MRSRLFKACANPAFVVLFILFFHGLHYYRSSHFNTFIMHDGKGYYAYLPAIFIHHDLNFGFFDSVEQRYFKPPLNSDYRFETEAGTVNKYFVGTALMQLPFFLAGHAVATARYPSVDGFENLYRLFIGLGALFYCALGIFFIDRVLCKFYNVPYVVRLIASVGIVFGTNVHYYAVTEPSMSHIYSLAAVSAWMFMAISYLRTRRTIYFFGACAVFGLILLIRPVNGLVVLALPFLAESLRSLGDTLKSLVKKPKVLITGLLIAILIPCLQFVVYKIQTGHWFVYGYGDETLDLRSPELVNFLFSYRKGLFVYTPFSLVILVLSTAWWKSNRTCLFAFWSFCFVVFYVLSSWDNWSYGGSFGCRPFIDYAPFFAITLALSLHALQNRRIAIIAVLTAVAACVALSEIQVWQYRHHMIHWDGMTREAYWNVFLLMK